MITLLIINRIKLSNKHEYSKIGCLCVCIYAKMSRESKNQIHRAPYGTLYTECSSLRNDRTKELKEWGPLRHIAGVKSRCRYILKHRKAQQLIQTFGVHI